MDYELIISERADERTDRLAAYLLNRLKNPGAAAHFLDELDAIYDRLIHNPHQFPDSPDEYLFLRGYREALFETTQYKVVYRIDNQQVLIVGDFIRLKISDRKYNGIELQGRFSAFRSDDGFTRGMRSKDAGRQGSSAVRRDAQRNRPDVSPPKKFSPIFFFPPLPPLRDARIKQCKDHAVPAKDRTHRFRRNDCRIG